jgi:cytochrome b pre-mRNA-processing protein 3
MDKNLREMGVSDISISKKMKPMLAAFYGRAQVYELAMAADDTALAEALRRNVFGKASPTDADVRALTDYVRTTHRELARQETAALLDGTLLFPPVA